MNTACAGSLISLPLRLPFCGGGFCLAGWLACLVAFRAFCWPFVLPALLLHGWRPFVPCWRPFWPLAAGLLPYVRRPCFCPCWLALIAYKDRPFLGLLAGFLLPSARLAPWLALAGLVLPIKIGGGLAGLLRLAYQRAGFRLHLEGFGPSAALRLLAALKRPPVRRRLMNLSGGGFCLAAALLAFLRFP